jgi:hypothetical protein
VALGRALLSDPALRVVDEAVSALDEPLKLRVLDYLARAIAEWHLPTGEFQTPTILRPQQSGYRPDARDRQRLFNATVPVRTARTNTLIDGSTRRAVRHAKKVGV